MNRSATTHQLRRIVSGTMNMGRTLVFPHLMYTLSGRQEAHISSSLDTKQKRRTFPAQFV